MRPRLDQRVARPRLLIQDWDQDFESQIQDRDCNFFDIIWPLPHNGVVTLLYVLYWNASFLTTAEDFIQFGVRARSLVKQTRDLPPSIFTEAHTLQIRSSGNLSTSWLRLCTFILRRLGQHLVWWNFPIPLGFRNKWGNRIKPLSRVFNKKMQNGHPDLKPMV